MNLYIYLDLELNCCASTFGGNLSTGCADFSFYWKESYKILYARYTVRDDIVIIYVDIPC